MPIEANHAIIEARVKRTEGVRKDFCKKKDASKNEFLRMMATAPAQRLRLLTDSQVEETCSKNVVSILNL